MFKYCCILFLVCCSFLYATVFEVGPDRIYKKPSQVMNLVEDGDTVLIDVGLYDGDAGIWRKDNLLIRGAVNFVHLKAAENLPQNKAIWIVQGNDNIIEYIQFSDAKVPDMNGAGIRFEGTNLTVRHCNFLNNENGILTGANSESTITIEFCEFNNNGFGDGYSHNLYIGTVKKFIFRYNYTHHAKVGHCIKSRAFENIIMYNRIMDENDGYSSYLINLPNGGLSYIAGNLLMQGNQAQNSKMLDYGSEGYKNPDNRLYVYNNTFVNRRQPCIFIHIVEGAEESEIANNIFAGASADASNSIPALADTSNNLHELNVVQLKFVDESNFDYRLTEDSPAIDIGKDIHSIPDYPNFMQYAYRHFHDSTVQTIDDKPDVGAYQFEKSNTHVESSETNVSKSYQYAGYLFVELSNNSPLTTETEILDLSGVTIIKGISMNTDNKLKIDIGNLPPGIYFYRLITDNKVLTGKFYKFN